MLLSRWNLNPFTNFLWPFGISLAPSETYHPFCSPNPQLSLLDTSNSVDLRIYLQLPGYSRALISLFPVLLESSVGKDRRRVHRRLLSGHSLPYAAHCPANSFLDTQCSFTIPAPHFPYWNVFSIDLEKLSLSPSTNVSSGGKLSCPLHRVTSVLKM